MHNLFSLFFFIRKCLSRGYSWLEERKKSDSTRRYQGIFLSGLFAMGSKGISVLTALISIPITVQYLGSERFGLWMTITSIFALLTFSDFGIGNGLLNAVAKAKGEEDDKSLKNYVSTSFFMLAGIAILVFPILYTFIKLFPMASFLHIESHEAAKEYQDTFIVLSLMFCLGLPMGTTSKIFIGRQEGFIDQFWVSIGSVLGLIGIIVGVRMQVGLPVLVLALSGGPLFGLLLGSVHLYLFRCAFLFPRFSIFKFVTAKDLLTSGSFFFLLQLFSLLGNSSDNLIIGHYLGAEDVSLYAITQKMFLSLQIVVFFGPALWPAFGEALAQGHYIWVKKALNNSLKVSLYCSVLTSIPLVLFGQRLVEFWVGGIFLPSAKLLLGFAFWTLLVSFGNCMSMILNNERYLRKQLRLIISSSVVSVLLKIVFVINYGLDGVIWGALVGYGFFYVIPSIKIIKGEFYVLGQEQLT